MQQVICSWIGVKWFTPIVHNSNETAIIYNRQCVRSTHGNNIQNPTVQLIVNQCFSKPAYPGSHVQHISKLEFVPTQSLNVALNYIPPVSRLCPN
nr:hypothetical protein Iba_chr02aCG21600 [Ipomoea batatas]